MAISRPKISTSATLEKRRPARKKKNSVTLTVAAIVLTNFPLKKIKGVAEFLKILT